MTEQATSLSEDQAEAIDQIHAWWQKNEKQTFSLAGYAGTGKTTVISALLESWPGDVVVAAPTGKAAHRLREKGVKATTIHQMAYHLVGEDEDGEPLFDYSGISRGLALVIIDEASMVNKEIHDDLVGDGYRMLFVGDHGQLAPVGEDPGIMRNPDFTLSKIHRQDDEGLLDFAHALREGDPNPEAHGAVSKLWIKPSGEDEPIWDAILKGDNVICWRNATRHWLNLEIFKRLEMLGDLGDRQATQNRLLLLQLKDKTFPVVCLRNDYKVGVFNGQVFNFTPEKIDTTTCRGVLSSYGGWERNACLDMAGFRAQRGTSPAMGTLLFDFGFVLTAHKSQGSEWDRVCVFDDTFSKMEDRARWQYTAATRAAKALDWLHR